MPKRQYDNYLGNFGHPPQLYDIGPPEQIAFYSWFSDINNYRFNDHSALRRYKGTELQLPLQLDLAVNREEFRATAARLERVPRPSLVPVIAACAVGSGSAPESVRNADVITRRDALSSLGAGEEMTFNVTYTNGKLHIERKDFVSSLDVVHNGSYYRQCFEEACTVSATFEPNGRFCSIVSRRLGDLNIVMAGEVDCAEGGRPDLECYRELKTQRSQKHKNWPKWYLQSYLPGVPMLILGNRSKHNLVTGLRPMSMETLLQTTVAHSPGFDPAFALGRIHSILSVLIQHCRTRAAYVYTGSFSCELHIRPGGHAFVPPVVSDIDAKLELLRVWEIVWEMNPPSGVPISRSLRTVVSEHYLLRWAQTAGPFVSLIVFQPIEYSTPFQRLVASFTFFIPLDIFCSVFWQGLPIATSVLRTVVFCAVALVLLQCIVYSVKMLYFIPVLLSVSYLLR